MPCIPNEVDVLIAGYGPVGAALAGLLGRYGIRTLVIDKSNDIFMAPRAIALDNEALRILQMVGLAEDAFDKVAIPEVRMHCPHIGEFACIDTTGSVNGHPKLVTFYQPELERVLRTHAEHLPSVTACTGVELERFVDDGRRVRAELRIVASGATATVQAKFLVGADGANSTVRKAIGQEFEGQTYPQDWLVVDAVGVPSGFDHVEFLCDPRRPTPHMVAPGGRTRWEFMLMPGESKEAMESDASIAELLRPWVNTADVRIERKAVYRFHARSCERFSVGRVFLVGDAAHITPPFVGQGLVAGLRDVANLGWKLAWVVDGRARLSTLDSYDEERRPHAAKMITLAKVMGRLVMPRDRLTAVVVHGLIALVRRMPGLRRLVDDLGAKPENAYARGLFVRGRGAQRRGAWFPQALVRDGEGHAGWSDDALGAGLGLVGLGCDPRAALSEQSRRAWTRSGGTFIELRPHGAGAGPGAFEDLENRLVAGAGSLGRVVVVRPDRTILHDGSVTEADRIVRESLSILGSAKAYSSESTSCSGIA